MASSLPWAGVLVFLVPALSLITSFGIGLGSFLFVLALPFVWREGRLAMARHWPAVRWVVLAFAFNFAVTLAFFALRPEQPLNSVEKPLRMFCAVSALMVVLATAPPRRALYWGAAAGAVGAFLLVGYQRVVLDIERPGGLTNAVIFGDMAVCLSLVALAAAIETSQRRHYTLWLVLGALAGVLASFISATRGAWVALGLAALLLGRHVFIMRSTRMRVLLPAGLALVASLYLIPSSGMQERVAQAISDVRAWNNGGDKFTNVGIRLELWKGAGMLVAERPLLGREPALAHARMKEYVAEGRLDPVALAPLHLHNDALDALVGGGVPGLLAWIGILLAPFVFFAREARQAAGRDHARYALALAGMLIPLSYFGFSLTDTMFWSVKPSMFYALMVFILMGLCLNQKEKFGN
ncbi:MAG: O-antigen ligase family protein [Pseudomonadota bacterium]